MKVYIYIYNSNTFVCFIEFEYIITIKNTLIKYIYIILTISFASSNSNILSQIKNILINVHIYNSNKLVCLIEFEYIIRIKNTLIKLSIYIYIYIYIYRSVIKYAIGVRRKISWGGRRDTGPIGISTVLVYIYIHIYIYI